MRGNVHEGKAALSLLGAIPYHGELLDHFFPTIKKPWALQGGKDRTDAWISRTVIQTQVRLFSRWIQLA